MEKRKARTLIYDLELAPNLGYTWAKWETNVIKFKEEWFILSFAYKWLGEPGTYVVGLDDFEDYKPGTTDDFNLVATLHELFDEADVIIAHNGNQFDQKKANARFIFHGLTPPSPYKQIDTLQVAKRYFKFTTNTLDDLGMLLKVGHKAQTGGFQTWLGCMVGDEKAWAKMKRYNKQDVVLLEKIYLKLRPWMANHPAINLIEGNLSACPKCSKGPMQKRGFNHTKMLTYQRFQCQHCHGWSQSRLSEKSIDKVVYVN